MATSVVTITVNNFPGDRDNSINHLTIMGTLAIAAGDYPAGGIPVSFTGIEPPAGADPIMPVRLESATSGYVYRYSPALKTIRIFQAGAINSPLAEIVTTTPAGVVSDTIYFSAMFNRT